MFVPRAQMMHAGTTYFDIFEPNVRRKRKINEIFFFGGGAWSREEEYEGVKCLSEIITKMANVDRHASHS